MWLAWLLWVARKNADDRCSGKESLRSRNDGRGTNPGCSSLIRGEPVSSGSLVGFVPPSPFLWRGEGGAILILIAINKVDK